MAFHEEYMEGKGLVLLSPALADEVNRRDGTCR
jgi:hypothetical protein